MMFVYNGHVYCSINATIVNNGGTSYADGAFHFAVCTYDGTTLTVYVDGTALNNIAASTPTDAGTGTASIGNDLAHTQTWNGTLDDARYYSRALSGTEVTSIYNSGVSGKP
jgi:hypothetical protein